MAYPDTYSFDYSSLDNYDLCKEIEAIENAFKGWDSDAINKWPLVWKHRKERHKALIIEFTKRKGIEYLGFGITQDQMQGWSLIDREKKWCCSHRKISHLINVVDEIIKTDNVK